ncbi:hypothetical protein BDP55DRAFT_124780 [Colletotrichum godetiae]|uniref:Secreted protein n=1 Tax=Colletotrichum godetiae TaxID=1209918 RepID=A0AAJ0AXU1_9PEZI|nr:uncharacterized protein BDP55DRAFT_124780 [Colletotrichum godetiae]KAK1700277.1 hypothetical protein BDP55DRAFT_124780 [Colletotrichum godetiae]
MPVGRASFLHCIAASSLTLLGRLTCLTRSNGIIQGSKTVPTMPLNSLDETAFSPTNPWDVRDRHTFRAHRACPVLTDRAIPIQLAIASF